jgi:hypothetical protein
LIDGEKITASEENAKLRLNFTAKKVFLVLGSENGKKIDVKISLNGKESKIISVSQHTLYELVNQEKVQNSLLEISTGEGLTAYAFTFGN